MVRQESVVTEWVVNCHLPKIRNTHLRLRLGWIHSSMQNVLRMKPFGTITKYYAFVEHETREIVESIVEKASNYREFAVLLGERACQKDVSLQLVYLAAVHAWWAREDSTINKLADIYKDIPVIAVWRFPIRDWQEDRVRQRADFRASFDQAVASTDNDWILVELLLLHAHFLITNAPVTELMEPLNEARHLIDSNSKLACFDALLWSFEG